MIRERERERLAEAEAEEATGRRAQEPAERARVAEEASCMQQQEQKRPAAMDVERQRLAEEAKRVARARARGILVAVVVVAAVAVGLFALRARTPSTPSVFEGWFPPVVNSKPGTSPQTASPNLPELTQPVNDFARVIDAENATAMDRVIRELLATTGDVLVVATVPTIEPYGDIREYAVKLFENHGRGIGEKAKNNGGLILLAVKERSVRIEVGAGLQQFITDGFADETIRKYMVPQFSDGRYGPGLRAGLERLAERSGEAAR
jgi:hypothetical protein